MSRGIVYTEMPEQDHFRIEIADIKSEIRGYNREESEVRMSLYEKRMWLFQFWYCLVMIMLLLAKLFSLESRESKLT